MKVWGKYNFLLLHDDGAAKSFRISRRAVRILMLIGVLLPLVGGVGIWIGWQAWQDRQAWEEEERVLQQEMADLRTQIDRLTHIDRLIQLSEAGQLPEALPNPASAVSFSPPPAENGQIATQPASVSAASDVSQAEASRQGPPEETFDPDKLAVDSGQVRIDAASAHLSKDRRLRVRLDLYNESGRQIAGTLLFFLQTADETRTALPHSDAAFRISRLKRFAPVLEIPNSVGDLAKAALVVEVVNSEKALLFRQFYPIAE